MRTRPALGPHHCSRRSRWTRGWKNSQRRSVACSSHPPRHRLLTVFFAVGIFQHRSHRSTSSRLPSSSASAEMSPALEAFQTDSPIPASSHNPEDGNDAAREAALYRQVFSGESSDLAHASTLPLSLILTSPCSHPQTTTS
jgi:hypothetical protein